MDIFLRSMLTSIRLKLYLYALTHQNEMIHLTSLGISLISFMILIIMFWNRPTSENIKLEFKVELIFSVLCLLVCGESVNP